jgi:hypothetical protein
MTPSITAGVLAGDMAQASFPASSGDSRWESSFHHGGTAITGQAGILGTVMATDTPGVMDTGMAGTVGIVITHIMDTITNTRGITIHMTDRSIPMSIAP